MDLGGSGPGSRKVSLSLQMEVQVVSTPCRNQVSQIRGGSVVDTSKHKGHNLENDPVFHFEPVESYHLVTYFVILSGGSNNPT